MNNKRISMTQATREELFATTQALFGETDPVAIHEFLDLQIAIENSLADEAAIKALEQRDLEIAIALSLEDTMPEDTQLMLAIQRSLADQAEVTAILEQQDIARAVEASQADLAELEQQYLEFAHTLQDKHDIAIQPVRADGDCFIHAALTHPEIKPKLEAFGIQTPDEFRDLIIRNLEHSEFEQEGIAQIIEDIEEGLFTGEIIQLFLKQVLAITGASITVVDMESSSPQYTQYRLDQDGHIHHSTISRADIQDNSVLFVRHNTIGDYHYDLGVTLPQVRHQAPALNVMHSTLTDIAVH